MVVLPLVLQITCMHAATHTNARTVGGTIHRNPNKCKQAMLCITRMWKHKKIQRFDGCAMIVWYRTIPEKIITCDAGAYVTFLFVLNLILVPSLFILGRPSQSSQVRDRRTASASYAGMIYRPWDTYKYVYDMGRHHNI